MNKIKIISLIRRQDPLLRELEEDYRKRIQKWVGCELVEVKRERISSSEKGGKPSLKDIKKLTRLLKENASLVVLDRKGKQFSSEELSGWLEARLEEPASELVFLIGGPLGLSEAINLKAKHKICLSELTFPHKLVRVVILEALYRALSISKGTPYHK